jgi:hypothetical protein
MKSELLQTCLFAAIVVVVLACAHGFQAYWIAIQERRTHSERELRIQFELKLQEAIERQDTARARRLASELFAHQNDVASSYLESAKDAATANYLAFWWLSILCFAILREYYLLFRRSHGGGMKK